MEQIWQWGISVIVVVQKIRSPFMDSFFTFVSFFGTLGFYICFLPFLYWCYNKKYASRIFILFLISGWVNTVVKYIINHPRPYFLDPSVKVGHTTGPGIPSGHAQQSLVIMGSLSLWLKNRKFTYFSVFIILLIAFSRIYLGVHFPTDILGGWFLGGLILLILWPLLDRIEIFLSKIDQRIIVSGIILVPVFISFFHASKSSVMSMGVLSGFSAGLIIEMNYIKFETPAGIKNYLLRYLSGILVLLLIFFSEKILFRKHLPYFFAFVFIHSWIVGVWISAGAPWLFKKFRI